MRKRKIMVKKHVKRVVAMLLSGALALGMFSPLKAYADTEVKEQEVDISGNDNNTPNNSQKINLNTIYVGNLSDGDDIDWYEFTIPEGKKAC